MAVRLYAHRYWRDEDSIWFLDDPKAMGLDPTKFRGEEVVIANGCDDGPLLADVVSELQRFGAKKIILTSLRRRSRVLRPLHRPRHS